MRTNHCSSRMEGVQYNRLAIIELTVPLHCSMISDLQNWSLLLKLRPLSAAVAASALERLLSPYSTRWSLLLPPKPLIPEQAQDYLGKEVDRRRLTHRVGDHVHLVTENFLHTEGILESIYVRHSRLCLWVTSDSSIHIIFPRPHGHQFPLLFFPSP